MMRGTGPADAPASSSVPTITTWRRDPVELGDVVALQLTAELRRRGREAMLPPALHPTDPPTLSINAWTVGASPWGPFSIVFSRVSCRSGVRARGLTTGAVVDREEAAQALAGSFGFPCRIGDVRLRVHYDATELRVDDSLHVAATDARPLGDGDVQHTGTMNTAHTAAGVRLVQVESEHRSHGVQRLRGRLEHFEASAWGDARLQPYDVVATTVERGTIVLPPVRFVCRLDVSAFEGTERIG